MPACHILLIDDHPLFGNGFATACAALRPEFTLTLAGTSAEGVACLKDGSGIDCVLIDILLPDADGFETLKACAQIDPLTPRAMISGRDDPQVRLRARGLGASGFISKSLAPEAIMAALDLVLSGGEWFQPFDTAEEAIGITARQQEVLNLLAQGCANKEIEDRLGLASRTVRAHLTEVFKELGVSGRARAVLEARRRGLIA